MIDPRARQAAYNRASRDQWDGFAPHRARVSRLLSRDADQTRTRLCVLGAGNGNDLDLKSLLGVHREVHLIDLDAAAVADAAARQGVADHTGLRLHTPVDLTGALELIAGWSPLTPIEPESLAALARWPAQRVALGLPGPFDVVASLGLLSQLIASAHDAVGSGHPRFDAIVQALRRGHFRLLARLGGAGGRATLITDVVSSDHLPALETLADDQLPDLLPRLARTGNHIHGVHPRQILDTLQNDAEIGPLVQAIEPAVPWRWRLHQRTYLVWAVSFSTSRRDESPNSARR